MEKIRNYVAHDCFKELVNGSEIFSVLSRYGGNIVPLSMVGLFMNYAGNHLLHHIYKSYGQKIFYHGHKVVNVQLLANGEVLTTAIKKQTVVRKNPDTGNIKFLRLDTQVQFRSKAILMSNGGKQHLHPHFYKWFPFMKAKS